MWYLSEMMTQRTDEDVKKNISANLKALLAERGETPYRLSKEIGEPLNSVYRIVRGENVAGAGFLSRIAEYLGVPVDDLLLPEKTFAKSRKRQQPA